MTLSNHKGCAAGTSLYAEREAGCGQADPNQVSSGQPMPP